MIAFFFIFSCKHTAKLPRHYYQTINIKDKVKSLNITDAQLITKKLEQIKSNEIFTNDEIKLAINKISVKEIYDILGPGYSFDGANTIQWKIIGFSITARKNQLIGEAVVFVADPNECGWHTYKR